MWPLLTAALNLGASEISHWWAWAPTVISSLRFAQKPSPGNSSEDYLGVGDPGSLICLPMVHSRTQRLHDRVTGCCRLVGRPDGRSSSSGLRSAQVIFAPLSLLGLQLLCPVFP